MKKSQVKVFEELLQDSNFKGKKQLRHLLWLNTSKPKFEVGDCFEVTDYGHRIYGHQVINFKARVVEVYTWKTDDNWYYKLEMEVICGDKVTISYEHKTESQLIRSKKCKDNRNVLGETKTDVEESLDI